MGDLPLSPDSATANGILEAVTDELLAHGEFSSGWNNRLNAREAARVVIDMVRTYDHAQRPTVSPEGVCGLVLAMKLCGMPKEGLNVGYLTDFETEQFEKFWAMPYAALCRGGHP